MFVFNRRQCLKGFSRLLGVDAVKREAYVHDHPFADNRLVNQRNIDLFLHSVEVTKRGVGVIKFQNFR